MTGETVPALSLPPALGDGECPYQGLAPFGPDRSDLFFGRAKATRNLLDRLAARLRPGRRGTLLLVSGASGVGKSSLLRAGLLPALARGELPVAGSRDWPRLVVTPGPDPLRALASAWTQAFGGDAEETCRCLTDDPRAVFTDAPRTVLVADQFEELFTLVTDEETRRSYVDALDALATGPAAAVVVVGLRADYWDRCAAYPRFAHAIQDGQVIVEPMEQDDLRLAIVGPAAATGLELEPGLVETILDELRARRPGGRYEAGALPLLSQALRSTWTRRENGRLTLRGYEESGRIGDAVRRTADEVLDGLTAEDRKTALRLFRRMILITAGGRLARRRASLPELRAAAAADVPERRERVAALLSAFADRRLITLDDDGAGISHDALLTAWPALRRWIAPDLAAQAVYDRLITDAEAWKEHHRDPDMLYQGARLLAVDDSRPRWERDPDSFPPPGPTATAFLAASRRAARRAARRRRLVTASLAALTVLAVTAAGAAVRAADTADDQRRVAVSRRLAVESRAAQEPDLAALLAVAAWRSAPTEEARFALMTAATRPGRGRLEGHGGPVGALAFSPDGTTVATGGDDRTVRLWDVASRRRIGAPIAYGRTCLEIGDVAFTAGGRTLAAACGAEVALWDVATRRTAAAPVRMPSTVNALAVSPDGRVLAAALSDGTIALCDARTLAPMGGPLGEARDDAAARVPVHAVTFGPDGRRLFSAHGDGAVRSWDTGTRAPTGSFQGHRSAVTGLALSPDGTRLATAGLDRTARVWDTSTREQVGALRTERPTMVTAIAYSPDGTRILTGDQRGRSRLWDARQYGPIGLSFSDNTFAVERVAFSPTGRLVAAAAKDGTVRLADPVTFQQTGTTVRARSALALSPDGRLLATGGPSTDDPAARLWDVATQRPVGSPLTPAQSRDEQRGGKQGARQGGHRSPYPVQLWFGPDGRTLVSDDPHGVHIWDVASRRPRGPVLRPAAGRGVSALSPDGRLLALQDGDAVRIRATGDGAESAPPIRVPGFTDAVTALRFAPDGRTLAATGFDRTARLFDVRTGRQAGGPLPFRVGVLRNDLAFSPDGRVLAVTADDSTVRLWDLRRGRMLGTPRTDQTEAVTAVAFSPDGRTFATGSMDNAIRLWDLRTLRQIGMPLVGHTRSVLQVAYTRDGGTVASIGADGTARLWNVAVPADLVAAACANAGRPLTRAEWERYALGEDPPAVCR